MHDLIYQTNPEFCTYSKFTDKEWTKTVKGYVYEANKLVSCALRNEDLSPHKSSWKVSINIEAELTVSEIKELWNKVSRKLSRKNINALWIREPSRKNHCNYNLIVVGEVCKDDLVSAIEYAMPDRTEIPWHKWIRPIRTWNQLHFCLRYFLKAEPKGVDCPDSIRREINRKRLLFKPHLGLRKCGEIGKFWVKPKKQLWEEIKDQESHLGTAPYEVKRLARDVAKVLWMNPKEVERCFCYYADTPVIAEWTEEWSKLKLKDGSESHYSLLG